MARNRKRPRRPSPATPRTDLSDWQGFRATRTMPRYRLLAATAVLSVITTILMAQFRHEVGEWVFEIWLFSLVSLQVLVVVESDRHLRGAWGRAAPVASTVAIAAFLVLALDASIGVALGLAFATLAIAFMPPSWHDWLLQKL